MCSYIYVTRFGKTEHIITTSEMVLLLHIIVPHCQYWLFSVLHGQEKAMWKSRLGCLLLCCHCVLNSIRMNVHTSRGFHRMAWTQFVSYMLASSSVVVGDWFCGLFGMWLQLGVPLGVFCNWSPVATLPPPPLPTTHLLFISTTPDITVVPVKASQNQAGQTINNDKASLLKAKKMLYYQCKSHASTTNYSRVNSLVNFSNRCFSKQ